MNKSVLAVIPARIGSMRLPRKMLASIGGKPLVWHTWNQVRKAKLVNHCIVATDSYEIRDALLRYGADVVMTRGFIQTGSDRVAHAAKLFKKFAPSIVINVQGDEPMMPPSAIDKTIEVLLKNKNAVMSTVATPLTKKEELQNPGVVKVVVDTKGRALYFSRSPIPYPREKSGVPRLKHLGIYGFRATFLQTFVKLSRTPLERTENLEQLRALEHGYPIEVGIGMYRRMEVNTKEELKAVRKMLAR